MDDEFILLSHDATPEGIVSDVVVCEPADQTHFIVSPRLKVKEEGENISFCTEIMCIVAFAVKIKIKIVVKNSNVFFIMIV